MSKIINNQIRTGLLLALGILAILALGALVMPRVASADRAGYVTPYNSTRYNNDVAGGSGYNGYVEPKPLSYTTPAAYYTGTPAVAGATTSNTASTAKKSTIDAESDDEEVEPKDNMVKNLAANAIYGEFGFMPSGIVQWILFAILILVIVILIRKIFGGEARYHSTPLKHA
jgi:hypothetical protein